MNTTIRKSLPIEVRRILDRMVKATERRSAALISSAANAAHDLADDVQEKAKEALSVHGYSNGSLASRLMDIAADTIRERRNAERAYIAAADRELRKTMISNHPY